MQSVTALMIVGLSIHSFTTEELSELRIAIYQGKSELEIVSAYGNHETHIGYEVKIDGSSPVETLHEMLTSAKMFEFATGKKGQLLVLPNFE